VGPLIGSLIGVSSMSIIFLVAGVMSVLACIPVLADADLASTVHDPRTGPRGCAGVSRSTGR